MVQALLKVLKGATKYALHSIVRKALPFNTVGTIKQLVKNPNKMLVLMTFLKANVLKRFGKANFIFDLKKYGVKETMRRLGKSITPMEIRKIAYFINACRNQREKATIKNDMWKTIISPGVGNGTIIAPNSSYNGGTIEIQEVKKLEKIETSNQIDKKSKDFLLDKTFWFGVKSPESHNFSILPHFANITRRTYGVPIRGVIPGYQRGKYYHFDSFSSSKHQEIVKKAMTTSNYGREVYSLIRSKPKASIKILIKDLYYNRRYEEE